MSMTVTATQGGATAGGTTLEVQILTGAKPASSQTGAAVGTQSTTPNLSITPTAAGSYLFSAVLSSTTATTAESGETVAYSASYTNLYFTHYRESGVTQGTPVLMGSSTSTGIAISNVEILNNGQGITVWYSQPSGAFTNNTSAQTNSFSPPPGALLIAMVASNGASGTTTMSITDTMGLTWTCLQQENGGGHGYVGIWVAQVPDPLPYLQYVWDVSSRSNVTSAQTVSYVGASQKSLILCCGSLYSSNNSVQAITSISDNAGNTWHYTTTNSQQPPYAGQVVSSQYVSTFIGWTWQDKGSASVYSVNFSGSAYINMDISEWTGVGSITNMAAIASTTTTTALVGPTVPVTTGSVAIAITNTINGALTTATKSASDGTTPGNMPSDSLSNFLIVSGNSLTSPLLPKNSPYNFTLSGFGSGKDYSTSIIVLNPRGAPTGSFFRSPGIPGRL